MSNKLHPAVDAIGQGFRLLGASTPSAFSNKAELLLTPRFPGERVTVCVGDCIRCSSTMTAAFAAGAGAMTVTEKSGRGPTLAQAATIGENLRKETVLAGELNGLPVPGGVFGNSPREIGPESVAGKIVNFRSTNFGAVFWRVVDWAREFRGLGGIPRILVISLFNLDAVADGIKNTGYDRVVVALGGFYDAVSAEDIFLGGDLLSALAHPSAELDDEARVMVAFARANGDTVSRLRIATSNWIGQALRHFGVGEDVAAAIAGTGIDPVLRERMSGLVLSVSEIHGVPVILPGNHFFKEGIQDAT